MHNPRLFDPNALTAGELDSLEDWQLLSAACHFGEGMNDCVELGYKYSLDEDGSLLLHHGKSYPACLDDDFCTANPYLAIEQYTNLSWRDLAKMYLKEKLDAK